MCGRLGKNNGNNSMECSCLVSVYSVITWQGTIMWLRQWFGLLPTDSVLNNYHITGFMLLFYSFNFTTFKTLVLVCRYLLILSCPTN